MRKRYCKLITFLWRSGTADCWDSCAYYEPREVDNRSVLAPIRTLLYSVYKVHY